MVKRYQSIYIVFTPPHSNVSMMINIVTEEIFGYKWGSNEDRVFEFNRGEIMKNYEDMVLYVKSNDCSKKWLTHYHNLFNYEDGTYLENMLFTLRRRYKKTFRNYHPIHNFSQN